MLEQLKILWLALRNPQDQTDAYTDKREWLNSAKAYADEHGDPVATLNTQDVSRFLFSTGRSIDLIHTPLPSDAPRQPPFTLDQVVLSLFSWETALTKTAKIVSDLQGKSWEVWTTDQPDSAFPAGSLYLLLATRKWKSRGEVNKAMIIRPHVFKIGGPRPQPFTGWQE